MLDLVRAALAPAPVLPLAGVEPRAVRVPTALDAACVQQWQYITSDALFNAVCCSRRAGKTNGAIPRAILMLARPGTWTHYVSLIRRNARKQLWRPLLVYLKKLGWEPNVDYWVNGTEMIITTAWGSNLQALAVDDHAGIKAVKGDRSNLFIIDECQEPNDDVLKALVDVAATPMLTDTGGMLDLLGTPPEAEPSFFSRALDGLNDEDEPLEEEGFKRFHWTMFDHDFPHPAAVKWERVKKIAKRRGFTLDVQEANDNNGRLVLIPGEKTHPTIKREYFGLRARDQSRFAYEYQAGRNDYDPGEVVFPTAEEIRSPDNVWSFALGLDLGWFDKDAIVVIGWKRTDPERRAYVVHQWQEAHQDVDMLTPRVREAIKRWHPRTIIGDHGGHSSIAVMATIEARLGILIGRKPPDVLISVGLVNDDLRTGRLLLPRGTPITSEVGKVGKSVNARTKKIEFVKVGFHSDLSEAMRYAHHGAFHYKSKAPKPEKTLDEKRIERENRRRRLAHGR